MADRIASSTDSERVRKASDKLQVLLIAHSVYTFSRGHGSAIFVDEIKEWRVSGDLLRCRAAW
jgi:hypothetical protein